MSALASKIESAARTNQMSQTMKQSVPALKKALKKMNANGIGADIAEFEKVFENMEVATGQMDAALDNVYGSSIPQDEVNSLLSEMQSENAMAAGSQMNQ